MNPAKERRRAPRYDPKVEVFFQLSYDLKTKVDFQVLDLQEAKFFEEKYSAVSKNVSSAGMCLYSERKVDVGALLSLDVYMPQSEKPVKMTAQVKWSDLSLNPLDDTHLYEVGLKVLTVEHTSVNETIKFDRQYDVEWSIVLESTLGNFKDIIHNQREG